MFGCLSARIKQLRSQGRLRTAETYVSALRSFRDFRCGADVPLASMNSALAEAYEAHLRRRGNSLNTVSFYMRILRAAYNRAVREGFTQQRHPFRYVYTGIAKTVKRALPLAVIREINALDLSQEPSADFARDMFMLSFFLRGMSFIDMAMLRKSDLQGGYLRYCRRKTGQRLSVQWTAAMQRIVDKYPANRTPYLLPIITGAAADTRRAYLTASGRVNRHLKVIGERVGLAAPLTMYCARHSWASVARAEGIPLAVISEGLGHDSEATTRIYLAALDSAAVDRANAQILAAL